MNEAGQAECAFLLSAFISKAHLRSNIYSCSWRKTTIQSLSPALQMNHPDSQSQIAPDDFRYRLAAREAIVLYSM
jgi:hypothetical protein